jgi:hypothetical protein
MQRAGTDSVSWNASLRSRRAVVNAGSRLLVAAVLMHVPGRILVFATFIWMVHAALTKAVDVLLTDN